MRSKIDLIKIWERYERMVREGLGLGLGLGFDNKVITDSDFHVIIMH